MHDIIGAGIDVECAVARRHHTGNHALAYRRDRFCDVEIAVAAGIDAIDLAVGFGLGVGVRE